MRLAARQFISMAQLTTLEAMRQPICLLLLTAAVVAISLLPFLITHALEDAEKLVRDSALAIHLVSGLFLGSYVACTSLVREIRKGTAASVLSKPVGREVFFVAKYTGVAALLLLFSLGAGLATVVGTRMASVLDHEYAFDGWAAIPLLAAPVAAYGCAAVANYVWRRPFNSVAFGALLGLLCAAAGWAGLVDPHGHLTGFGAALPLRVLPASLLVTLAILVLSAAAVSLATRLDIVPTVSICGVLLMAGLMSDYLLGRPAAAGSLSAAVLYRLVPNWQHFWVVDALSGGGSIAPVYLLHAATYAALYVAGTLCLGALGFRTMELK